MAIEFNCPHCQHAYRLPDKFAGKAAKCKNPECRQLITIPAPIPLPDDDAPELSQAQREAIEAAALSALNDDVSKEETPAAEKVIPMVCKVCDHKWNEPWSKAGKNTLCPNPECRQVQKVPEPKEDVPTDWRQQKSKLPSMAKQHSVKLEGVQDAGDVKIVSGKALVEADATGIEIEPRTPKEKLFIVFAIVALVGAIGGGTWYLLSRRISVNEEFLMVDAIKEFDKTKVELNPPDAQLCSCVLNLAAAEYALRHDDAKKLKEARDLYTKARTEVQLSPTGPARNALAAAIALDVLAFGGTDEQVKDHVRFRWQPDAETGKTIKLNEGLATIHGELRTTLGLLLPTPQAPIDFDLRIALTRQLTRKLATHGQARLAADLIPLALFTEPERDEARAAIALELFRGGESGSSVARTLAEELKTKLETELKARQSLNGIPAPASAQILFGALNIEKAPHPFVLQQNNSAVADPVRQAYTGTFLLEGNSAEALKIAMRPGDASSQLRALVLCAEWMADPTQALETAREMLDKFKGSKTTAPSPYLILRLVQIAAEKEKPELAKSLAEAITSDGMKAWAKGEIVRLRIAGNPKEKADESWAELPDEPKKQKAGHAWGRLWVARQNAKLSHNRDAEKKATVAWPPTIHPFALAGIALGLQDK